MTQNIPKRISPLLIVIISVYCIGCKNSKKDEPVTSIEVENQNILQEPKVANLNPSSKPDTNSSPSNDPSKTLKKNIPKFEEQIKRIEAQAVEFETTHKLPEVAADIRDKVSKTQIDNPQSLTKLAGYIQTHPNANKWNDNIGCAFDLMRLAIVNQDEKVMVTFFMGYWNKKYIPPQYVDESFEIVKSYAAAGNSRAIIALACTRIYANSNRPTCDYDELKKEFPNESNPGLVATIMMLEEALKTELDVPKKEMRRQMTGLLSTAYAYSGNKQRAKEILEEAGTRPDSHLERVLERDNQK